MKDFFKKIIVKIRIDKYIWVKFRFIFSVKKLNSITDRKYFIDKNELKMII